MKILLVEDSRRLRQSIKKGLESEGFQVDTRGEGRDGLAAARTGDYAVIILDLMLPGMDGMEILQRLREKGNDHHVLILTARDKLEDRLRGLDGGADDYLSKPFSFEELVARVRVLARRHQEREQGRGERAGGMTRTNMDALTVLTTGIAHELNTPLGIGLTAASYLGEAKKQLWNLFEKGQLTQKDLRAFLEVCDESGSMLTQNLQRLAGLVDRFKRVGAPTTGNKQEPVDIRACFERNAQLTIASINSGKHDIRWAGPEHVTITGLREWWDIIFHELTANALKHGFEPQVRGLVTLSAETDGDWLALTFEDDGKGVPEELTKMVFNPFFTTARGSSGMLGLGLNIVYNLVVCQMGGHIGCERKPQGGTLFRLRVPSSSP